MQTISVHVQQVQISQLIQSQLNVVCSTRAIIQIIYKDDWCLHFENSSMDDLMQQQEANNIRMIDRIFQLTFYIIPCSVK